MDALEKMLRTCQRRPSVLPFWDIDSPKAHVCTKVCSCTYLLLGQLKKSIKGIESNGILLSVSWYCGILE